MRKHITNIIIIFLIVIALELTVFNFKSYRVFNSNKSRTFTDEDFVYIEPEAYMSLYHIYNVNEEIKTIHIELKGGETVTYEVSCDDESSSKISPFPNKVYVDNFESSKYLATYLSRKN